MKKFQLHQLLLVAMLAALSVASKPFVFTVSSFATSHLLMPAGIVGGIWYMMWLSLTWRLVPRRGSVLLFGLVQAFLVIVALGTPPIKAATYIPPVLVAEMVYYFLRKPALPADCLVGALANFTGTVTSFLLFFGNQKEPLLIAAGISLISGALSGFLTAALAPRLQRALRLTGREEKMTSEDAGSRLTEHGDPIL